ncbi:hypothetical protein PIB30_007878 [Stylosanthes scabra]|uniref:Uncharacterized protein n=1 Tax=Stylosanthes scabra TaxID=79078 RepID=A0ABU6R4A5_9FABA|nr:hypothetical protein [Stylosanthes scabra]
MSFNVKLPSINCHPWFMSENLALEGCLLAYLISESDLLEVKSRNGICAGSSRQFWAKQPIRRQSRKSPPPSEPPTLSQPPSEPPILSQVTLAATSVSTQKKFRFMQTPGLNNKQQ